MSPVRLWYAQDAWMLSDDKIRQLGYEFGADAILVWVALLELAKQQGEDGLVRARYDLLADRAFVTPDLPLRRRVHRAKEIVHTLEGALRLITFEAKQHRGDTAESFTAAIENWSKWQLADPSHAARQARYRRRQRDGGVTVRDGNSDGRRDGAAVTSDGPTGTETTTATASKDETKPKDGNTLKRATGAREADVIPLDTVSGRGKA